jgi:hypothetical protein
VDDQTEQARRGQCLRRGWLLAMSGEAAGWREVEALLVARGWPEAPRWLADEDMRRKMDETCQKAREIRDRGTTGGPGRPSNR